MPRAAMSASTASSAGQFPCTSAIAANFIWLFPLRIADDVPCAGKCRSLAAFLRGGRKLALRSECYVRRAEPRLEAASFVEAVHPRISPAALHQNVMAV